VALVDPPWFSPELTALGIQALEEDVRRPVLTANQVLFWHLLHLAGTRLPVTNYGRLFTRELPD
jgi:maleate isomerase